MGWRFEDVSNDIKTCIVSYKYVSSVGDKVKECFSLHVVSLDKVRANNMKTIVDS